MSRGLKLAAALAGAFAVAAPAQAAELPTPTIPPPIKTPDPLTTPQGSPFEGNGMWVWYTSKSSGGTPARIAKRAVKSNIQTVFVKSSDGPNYWSQFNLAYVNE